MVGAPYNPNTCIFIQSQALNANQFNLNVPDSDNLSTHNLLYDTSTNRFIWVDTKTNLIVQESAGGDSSEQGTFNYDAYVEGNVTLNIPTSKKPKSVLVWCICNTLLDNTGAVYKSFSDPAEGNLGSYHGLSRGLGYPDDSCTCYYYNESLMMVAAPGGLPAGNKPFFPVLFESRFALEIAFRDAATVDSGIYSNITNFQDNSFDMFIGTFGNKFPIVSVKWVAIY